MPLDLRSKSQRCTLTGVGDVTLHVEALSVHRYLKFAAALVQNSEASERPAVFLSLMLSLACRGPFWTFGDATALPISAREEAVNIFIAESPYREAFDAQPIDLASEWKLYNVFREELEGTEVTDELRNAATMLRDLTLPKDPYADILAQVALPSSYAANAAQAALSSGSTSGIAQTGLPPGYAVGLAKTGLPSAYAASPAQAAVPEWLVRENQALTRLAQSVQVAAQRIITDPVLTSLDRLSSSMLEEAAKAARQFAVVRPEIERISSLNSNMAPASAHLAKLAQVPVMDLAPHFAETFQMQRFDIETHLLVQPNAYRDQIHTLGAELSSAVVHAAARPQLPLGAVTNTAALMSGLSHLSDTFAKQTSSMRSALQSFNQDFVRALASVALARPFADLQAGLYIMPQPHGYVSRESLASLRLVPQPSRLRFPIARETDDAELYQGVFDQVTEREPETATQLDSLQSRIDRLERHARFASSQYGGGRPSYGSRIVEARERFNVSWLATFPACMQRPLRAEELELDGVYQEVHDRATFTYSLGCLEIVSSDGGMDQAVFDLVSPRKYERGANEKPLKHLQRILHEVLGLTQLQARALMGPLFMIRDLRNALPPMHRTGTEGRKVFDSIGHPLPLTDPAACWDHVAGMYVDAINRLSREIRMATCS